MIPWYTMGSGRPIKYARLVRRKASSPNAQGADGEGYRYCVQLICRRRTYQKPKHTTGTDVVGLDLGPSTIAIVPQEGEAQLLSFCEELKPEPVQKRRLQRKLDRQRRANNPQHYDDKGRIQKVEGSGGVGLENSKGYQATSRRLAHLERKLAAHRKSLHGRLAHEIIRRGNTIRPKSSPTKPGRNSMARVWDAHAPGMFLEQLRRTVASTGGILQRVFYPYHQTVPVLPRLQSYVKKPLSQRWHQCACGIGPVQRDLYSAWLAAHLHPQNFIPSIAQATWEGAETRLLAAVEELRQRAKEGQALPQSVGIPRAGARLPESLASDYQELCFPMEDVEAMARWQDPPSEADGGVSDIDLDACPAHMQRVREISACIGSGKLRARDRETIGRVRTRRQGSLGGRSGFGRRWMRGIGENRCREQQQKPHSQGSSDVPLHLVLSFLTFKHIVLLYP